MPKTIVRRDRDGLLIQQRRVLQAIATSGDPRRACEQEKVAWRTFKDWLLKDEAFQHRYDELFGFSTETIREQMEGLGMKAVDAFDDALEAETVLEHDTVCPKCAHSYTTRIVIADKRLRKSAAETVLKVSGALIDRREIQQTTVRLDFEEALAWAAYRYGRTIPPHLAQRLRQKGKVLELPEGGNGHADDPAQLEDARVDRV